MPEPLPFGRWLKHLRAELDLTQEALAEAVGCASQTVRTFESGKRRPSRDMAERLAEVLRVPREQRAEFVRLARLPASPASAHPAAQEQDQPWDNPDRARAAAGPSSGPRDGEPVPIAVQPVPELSPVLATKLYMPRPRAGLVSRPRLLTRLEAGLAGPLTLIAAPAGFGKTTVLVDCLSHKDPGRFKVAWLALDAGDSDPSQFLRYLIAALQAIEPRIGAAITPLLRAAQAPPIETVLPLLVNDLTALPEWSILVLDDYHVVEAPSVHQALAFLLDHLPPQLRLVITTRVDPPLPLARLRARRDLTELRAYDLRFTLEEVAVFLREVMDLSLSVADVAALEARTEGWIAGLQLAALSLQDRPHAERAAFIESFTGSHRFVVDYLVDEVLARQLPHLQTFLLQTSILERLSGALCDAVVLGDVPDMQHAYSQLLLEELERNNLFIVPLDDGRRWYRYHHLFAQVLHQRLVSGVSPEVVATLHQRASGWFERQELITEAVRHALAAMDWERAARLIEEHGRALLVNGQVRMVLDWLNTFPDSQSRAYPHLLHLRAMGLFFVNELEAAERQLRAVEEAWTADPLDGRSQTILAYATLLRATIARFRGDLTDCVTLAKAALERLPAADLPRRVTANIILASAVLANGDVSPPNERILVAAVASARAATDRSTLLNGIVNLAGLYRRQGRLGQAFATYHEAEEVASQSGGMHALGNGAAYYFGLGDLLRERNDLDAAEGRLMQGRTMVLGALAAEADSIASGYMALAWLRQARGDGLGAYAALDELSDVARQRNFADHLVARIAAARAHLALRQGDLQSSGSWAELGRMHPDDDLSYPREQEYLTLVRVRVAQGHGDPAGAALRDATRLLDRLLASAEAGARMDSVIQIVILRALTLQAQGALTAALTALQRALTLAAPEGYVRVFVDEGAPMAALLREAQARGIAASYVAQLRAAFLAEEGLMMGAGEPSPPIAARLLASDGDLLTEREAEALRLLVAGKSNRAIADELVVAVGTVKRHLNSIFGKIGVRSRLEAVTRVRALNLE